MSSQDCPITRNLGWKKALVFGTGALLAGYCMYTHFSGHSSQNQQDQQPTEAPQENQENQAEQVEQAEQPTTILKGPDAKISLKIIKKTVLTHDTTVYRLDLGSPNAQLGMPIGHHIRIW